ncbi:hypothetical protein ACJ7RV_002182 [Vibrio parahaemolyticus]
MTVGSLLPMISQEKQRALFNMNSIGVGNQVDKKKALQKAIDAAGGKRALADSIGCSVRNINLMLSGDGATSKLALKISMASGIHVCELCPEFYPPEIFSEMPIPERNSEHANN